MVVGGVLGALLVSAMAITTVAASAGANPTRRDGVYASLLAVLKNPHAPAFSYFGFSVAVSDGTAVVGAAVNHHFVGAAYIYVEGPAGWPTEPTVRLEDPVETSDEFGGSVAISGNTLIVGAPAADGDSGVAYVYVEGASGWPTMPTVTLTDPAGKPQDLFGSSVAVSGTTAIVGAPIDVSPNEGNAYIYEEGDSGWPSTPNATLPDPAPGSADENFGSSVAVSPTTAVVGAPGGLGTSPGPAYIYTNNGTSVWQTTPIATLADPAASDRDYFGGSVAVAATGAQVLVGAPGTDHSEGRAYIYEETESGWPTAPTTTLPDPGVRDDFGFSVAESGNTIVIGNRGAPGNREAYAYTDGASGWPKKPTLRLADPKPGAGGGFGNSIGVSGTTAIVGDDTAYKGSGAAFMYHV